MGRHEKTGQRVALVLFLGLASWFVVSTVYQYATMVFWPKAPVAAGDCRAALARTYASLREAANTAEATSAPVDVSKTFLARTEAMISPPPSCAADSRGVEAAEALGWVRGHIAERLNSAAKTDFTIRNELVEAYLQNAP